MVAGANFCFFIAVPSGGGCWYYAKCEMVLCKIDGEINMQNCAYSANGEMKTVATDAPWLTAMTVATDSHHHFSKRWHVADVKNNARDGQATLMIDQNSTNITHTFWFYIYEIATDAPWLIAVPISLRLYEPILPGAIWAHAARWRHQTISSCCQRFHWNALISYDLILVLRIEKN